MGVENGAESPDKWQGEGTILLVDDDELVLGTTQWMLEACGFSVLTACDGLEGVDLFQEHCDELVCVLLDLMMPRMSGDVALSKMQAIRADVPIVVVSGYSPMEVTERFKGHRMAGFLQKPFTVNELVAELRRILEG